LKAIRRTADIPILEGIGLKLWETVNRLTLILPCGEGYFFCPIKVQLSVRLLDSKAARSTSSGSGVDGTSGRADTSAPLVILEHGDG
jgi:hypothetical protein